MTLQEQNTEENNNNIPESLPEARPPEVKTAAKVEERMKEGVVPSGAVKPEIIGKESVKEAIVKDVVKQEEDTYIPSINDFTTGKTFMLGDEEVNPDLIANAKAGNQDAILDLADQIDNYALTTKGPKIPAVRFDATGTGKVVKITDDVEVQEELTKYGQARLDLYNRMKGIGLRDENALNALVKYYSTGDFLQEGGKRVTQLGAFISQVPFGVNIGRHLLGSVYDSIGSIWDDFENPIEQFKKRLPQISQEFNSYRSFIEDDLGLKGVTYGSLIDFRVKQKIKEDLIKKHGKEEGEDIAYAIATNQVKEET